ncbi:MAG: DUF2282 domain-containing protein [Alphaproteobacteria bacterium]
MKTSSAFVGSAFAAALSLVALGAAQAGPAEKPSFKFEKCGGIAKAGMNDCQTATSSCAGTSKKDNQADAWIFVPAGTCAKINGGAVKT